MISANMINSTLFLGVGGISLLAFLLFYVRPLRRDYLEMSERAALFARRGDVMRNEKMALLENLDEGVIVVDGSQRISYLNLCAQKFMHLEGDSDILGKPLLSLVDKNSSRLWKEAQRVISEALSAGERSHASVSEGEEKIHLELVAIPTSNCQGALLIIQDHSNQQKMLDMGKDFIANASHELRTPVTIIRGFAETLRDLEEVSEEMYNSILEKIIRNCERMESLVKNLLMLTDLDNTSLTQVRECDLIDVIESSCNQILNIHPNIRIEQIQNADEIILSANPDLLELAFVNLLKNAVKYSEPPIQIKIIITKSADEVQIDFEDQGIGIPEKDLGRIFDRFYTVDKAHSRKLGGAGLGLSIVKIIVAKHGGTITAKRNQGKGTTFTLTLLTS